MGILHLSGSKFFDLERQPDGVDSSPMRFIASTGAADRVGDRVLPMGIDLSNFEKNPIVLFNHEHESPIGTAKVWVEGNQLLMEPTFSDASERARETAALVKDGVLKAVSIGFMPLETKPNEAGGFDIVKSELLEVSIVSVPMNQEAVRIKAMTPDEVAAAIASFEAKLDAINAKLDEILAAVSAEESTEEPAPESESKSVQPRPMLTGVPGPGVTAETKSIAPVTEVKAAPAAEVTNPDDAFFALFRK